MAGLLPMRRFKSVEQLNFLSGIKVYISVAGDRDTKHFKNLMETLAISKFILLANVIEGPPDPLNFLSPCLQIMKKLFSNDWK